MKRLLFAVLWAAYVLSCPNEVFAQVPPCGTVLATYRGIPARSNEGKGLKSCAGDNPGDRGVYGWQYQCVEYIKRFYGEALLIDTTKWSGNAVSYFSSAAQKQLISFPNSGPMSPAPDDILVFDSGDDFGHVAIVTQVSANQVTIIEQNWSSTGTAALGLDFNNGNYTVVDRLTSSGKAYHVLGWLRLPPREFVVQPGPGTGKDIWTTSIFSYAPSGGGPGGGLDDYELVVGGWGDLYFSLLQFDLAGAPKTARSAHLQLFCFTQRGVGTTGIFVDRITQFWDWRTQGSGSDRLRLWWADRPAAASLTAQALPAPTVGQWYDIDISDLYNAWQIGAVPNFGLQLRPSSNNNQWAEFFSSDYVTDPSLRPKLVIQFP